jgi:hypothetical protein
MALFITIFQGPTPAQAHPLLAVNDAEILNAVRRILVRRLSENTSSTLVPLKKPARVPTQEPPGASHEERD